MLNQGLKMIKLHSGRFDFFQNKPKVNGAHAPARELDQMPILDIHLGRGIVDPSNKPGA